MAVGITAVVLYLTVVVITTPSLRPFDAVAITLGLNWWLILGIASGTGVQAFLLSFAKTKACSIRYKGAVIGTSGFFSGLSSFLSFLSLIPVGCCGTWIYIISFLPGLIGVSASGFLTGNSLQIQVTSLVLMAASVAYTFLSVRKKLARLVPVEGDKS